MNRLCVVLAHGGALETVLRHLPYWKRLHDRVIIASPSDDPINLTDEWCFVNGLSGRYDAKTNIRTRELMLFASQMNTMTITFCEYDAILWRWPKEATIMGPNAIMASKFISDDRKFIGKFYLHSPIIFSNKSATETVEAMFRLPDDAERGFGDRYFGLACERARVDLIDGHKLGLSYSQNHIQQVHMPDAVDAIKAGACFTHGIKDASTLAALAKAAGLSP